MGIVFCSTVSNCQCNAIGEVSSLCIWMCLPGNPRVTPDVTRDVCLLARLMASNIYFAQIEELMFEVSLSQYCIQCLMFDVGILYSSFLSCIVSPRIELQLFLKQWVTWKFVMLVLFAVVNVAVQWWTEGESSQTGFSRQEGIKALYWYYHKSHKSIAFHLLSLLKCSVWRTVFFFYSSDKDFTEAKLHCLMEFRILETHST